LQGKVRRARGCSITRCHIVYSHHDQKPDGKKRFRITEVEGLTAGAFLPGLHHAPQLLSAVTNASF
jgi:hypothetical protein